MLTIGVDYHKRTSTYAVWNEAGQRLARERLENDREEILRFLGRWSEPKHLAMEASRSWGLLYELVGPHVAKFSLGHPKKMRAITDASLKNDAMDADTIARLAQSGFLPPAYVRSSDQRHRRAVIVYRGFLVKQRAAIKNTIQTLLDRNMWPGERPQSFKDPFCQRGMRWMKQISLRSWERYILDQALQTYEHLSERIEKVNGVIAQWTAEELPGLSYLRSVPGFRRSRILGPIVLLEIGAIERFRKAKHLAHYAGLIPSERSSGDKRHSGRLIRDANKNLRTALIEATLAALRADPGLKAYYQTVKERAGSGSAIVACARKLSYAVYHVLKDRVPYRPHPMPVPSATACHP